MIKTSQSQVILNKESKFRFHEKTLSGAIINTFATENNPECIRGMSRGMIQCTFGGVERAVCEHYGIAHAYGC